MARWITSDYLAKVLIDKGLTAGEARAFSQQDWVLDLAESAALGNLPKNAPKFTPETLQQYRQKAKDAGVPLIDYVQQQFAPQTIKTTPAGPPLQAGVAAAAQAAADIPQPVAPTPASTLAAPTPPAAAAPAATPPAVAAPAAPTSELYHKPYTLTPADTSDAVVNKIYNESDKSGPASYGPIIGSGINRLDSEERGPSSTLKDVFFSMGHDGKTQQYTASSTKAAPPEAAAQIRSMIQEQASGTVPNPAGNATDYLFAGASKGWIQKNNAQQIGGNWYVPKGKNVGGYADASPINPAQTQVAATRSLAPEVPQPAAAPVIGGAPDASRVTFAPTGVRNQALDPMLQSQLNKTAALQGVTVKVFSGGQDATGDQRTGSHRHDVGTGYADTGGGAADLKLYDATDGHLLVNSNPADLARMQSFTQEMVSEGQTGVGSGIGEAYMGPAGIHIGAGGDMAWGAGGHAKNAPAWVKDALAAGLDTPPIPSRNPAAAGTPQPEIVQAPPAAPPPPDATSWDPSLEPTFTGKPGDFGPQTQYPTPPPPDLSTDWQPPVFAQGDFGPPTPQPPVLGGGVGYDTRPPSADPSMMQRPLEPQLGPLAPPVLGAPVLGGMGGALASNEDALGPLLDPGMPLPTRNPGAPAPLPDPNMPLPTRAPAPPLPPPAMTFDPRATPTMTPPPQISSLAAGAPALPSDEAFGTYNPAFAPEDASGFGMPQGLPPAPASSMGIEQPPPTMFDGSLPGTNAVDAFGYPSSVQNFSGGFDPQPMVGGAPSPFSTGGPPGTVPSSTDPNTYLPASLQTQSSINQPPMNLFDPATAPPLGAPSMLPNAPGLNVSGTTGFPQTSFNEAGWPYGPVDVPPGTTPLANQSMMEPFNPLTAPTLSGLPQGPNVASAPDMMAPGLPSPSRGFDPTAGAPPLGAPSSGSMPAMPSWAMPGAFGMPGAGQGNIGGLSPMQYAGGTSVPTSMASSTGAYTGLGTNPATLGIPGMTSPMLGMVGPGPQPGMTDWSNRATGGIGGGPISEGASSAPAGNAASSASMESHALQLMAAQDAANYANAMSNFGSHTSKGPPQMTLGASDIMGLTGGIGLNKILANSYQPRPPIAPLRLPDVIRPYGMNVGFNPSFGSRF